MAPFLSRCPSERQEREADGWKKIRAYEARDGEPERRRADASRQHPRKAEHREERGWNVFLRENAVVNDERIQRERERSGPRMLRD